MGRPLGVVAVLGVLASAAISNSADTLAIGKWVRHWNTGTGHQTATLCLPATEPDALAQQIDALPERIAGVQRAGATAVVLDFAPEQLLPLVTDGHLQRLAESGPLVVPAGLSGIDGSKLLIGDRSQSRKGVAKMVMGIPTQTEHPPIGLVGLAAHLGAAPPAQRGAMWSVDGVQSTPTGDVHLFMPYLIPFVHWSDKGTWAQAKGRVVTAGACRLDRDLTRYGRQPTAVAHGEWIETLLAQQDPLKAPWWLDAVLGLVVFAGCAAPGRRRLRGVCALGLGLALGVSLLGSWMALTPVLTGAAFGIAWRSNSRTG